MEERGDGSKAAHRRQRGKALGLVRGGAVEEEAESGGSLVCGGMEGTPPDGDTSFARRLHTWTASLLK